MTGLETHPTLAGYRLALLQHEHRLRAQRTLARQTAAREHRPRGGGRRVIRALPLRMRGALR